MKYRLPQIEDAKILKEYVEEHYSNYERSISASLGMTNMNYNEWVDKINRNANIADDEWGRYYLYLVFDDNDKLIGLLNIRFDLTDELRERYGDIGYGVRPSERRKGYATVMLKYALNVCRENDMKYAILGCYENNYGSNKTIQNNKGVFYKNNYEERKLSDEWTIKLKCNYYKIEL
jgi:predicted acetyltransferase